MTTGTRYALAICFAASMSVSVSADQGPGLSRVMREKLGHAQAILGAVIKSDWPTLDRESRALALAQRDPAWAVLTAPQVLRQSDAFVDALQDLIEASARRDLEAAANAHVALTMTCVQCHLHMTRQRIGK